MLHKGQIRQRQKLDLTTTWWPFLELLLVSNGELFWGYKVPPFCQIFKVLFLNQGTWETCLLKPHCLVPWKIYALSSALATCCFYHEINTGNIMHLFQCCYQKDQRKFYNNLDNCKIKHFTSNFANCATLDVLLLLHFP